LPADPYRCPSLTCCRNPTRFRKRACSRSSRATLAIKAEANRDIQAFAATLQAANRAHRPLPACPPRDSNGWKFTFNTDEVLKFYRSIPPQQRAISSVQGFAEFMRIRYPCR